MKKQFFLLTLLLSTTVSILAEDFTVGGIYYKKLTANTVEVTYRGSYSSSYADEYSGILSIPSTVDYEDVTYSVVAIGDDAFYENNGLVSISIPKSVISISKSAFNHCANLMFVTIDAANPMYYSQDNCIITTRTSQLVAGCNGCIIPSDSTVTSIAENAFYGRNITSITIPNSVTEIGQYAFYRCEKLTDIVLPADLTTISSSLFAYCFSLASVTIPGSVTTIGESVFYDCSALEKVTYTGTVESWCTLFSGSGYYSNPLHESADFYINADKVTDITLNCNPSNIFRGCTSIENVTLSNSVQNIDDNAFYGCTNLASISIPNSVEYIGYSAFYNCTNLKSIIIPNKVTYIESRTFYNCTSLESVTIPNSVTSIYSNAFSGCTGLKKVIVKSMTPPSISSDLFPINVTIVVPCGTKESVYYKDAEWGKYAYYEEAFLVDWHVESADETQGTVEILSSPSTCDENEASFQAVPAVGYKFKSWADGNSENPRTVAITEEVTYTALFVDANAAEVNYELNGGVTNDYYWATPQDMYNTFTDILTTYNSTLPSVWIPLNTSMDPFTSKIATPYGCGYNKIMPSLLDDANFQAKFAWLDTYLTATCAANSKTDIRYEDGGFLRSNLTAFFFDTIRGTWPATPDYKTCGVSTPKAYASYWKGGFINPKYPTETVTLHAPYKEGCVFEGWYTTPDFSGEAVTTVDEKTIATLYAKWSGNPSTSVEKVTLDGTSDVRKVLENGTLYILRDGKKYTIDGMLVK